MNETWKNPHYQYDNRQKRGGRFSTVNLSQTRTLIKSRLH